MAKKETTSYAAPLLPMLKTVEQMSKTSCASLWIVASLNISKMETAA